MKDARRPTTAFSASITIHFFSTSAGFSEAVVLVVMMGPKAWASGPPAGEGAQVEGDSDSVKKPSFRTPQRLEIQGVDRCGNMIPSWCYGRRARQAKAVARPSRRAAPA